MRLFIYILVCFTSTLSFSQDWRTFPPKKMTPQSKKNSKIDTSYTKQTGIPAPEEGVIYFEPESCIADLTEKNHRILKEKSSISGYRVQIFSASGTNSRKNAEKQKADFILKYPDIPAEVIYQSPYFKTRVGYFSTKSEAIKFQNEIFDNFPASFVVKDNIPIDIVKAVYQQRLQTP